METNIREMQAEIERLKVEISSPRASPIQTAVKDVTLVAGIKDRTGDSRGRPCMNFSQRLIPMRK
jgi:hypothetical protein